MYEANPIALLVEQAGGRASTGRERVLDLRPASLHERVPFFAGSTEDVLELEASVARYNPPPPAP